MHKKPKNLTFNFGGQIPLFDLVTLVAIRLASKLTPQTKKLVYGSGL